MTDDELAALVEAAPDADDALRTVVTALAAEPGVVWAGIAFSDRQTLLDGPSAGLPDETRRQAAPVLWEGTVVGELRVDGELGSERLTRVAQLIAAHVLIGWDTGGESWEP